MKKKKESERAPLVSWWGWERKRWGTIPVLFVVPVLASTFSWFNLVTFPAWFFMVSVFHSLLHLFYYDYCILFSIPSFPQADEMALNLCPQSSPGGFFFIEVWSLSSQMQGNPPTTSWLPPNPFPNSVQEHKQETGITESFPLPSAAVPDWGQCGVEDTL